MVQGGSVRPGAAELLAILSTRLAARGKSFEELPTAEADKLAAALEELGFGSALERAKLRKALLSQAAQAQVATEEPAAAVPPAQASVHAETQAISHLAPGWLLGKAAGQRGRAKEPLPAPPAVASALKRGLVDCRPRRCRPGLRGQGLLRERALAESAAPCLPPAAGVAHPCVRCGQQRRVVASDGHGYCDLCLPLWEAGAAESLQDVFRDVATAEDSDGETVGLCSECGLPLGEFAYSSGKDTTLHGECLAQLVFRDLREHEEGRQRASADRKQANLEEHGIGWIPERVPSSLSRAEELGCRARGKGGMYCVVLDEVSLSVRVEETCEPAAGVNLEYLALALEVRRSEGREPLFSLDSTDPSRDPSTSMQVKRFEPSWLEGTSMGEVLFQADYHLKELSMGEHRQPVVGMKSSFEMSEVGSELDGVWNAREWFVINKAEVRVSAEGVLVPCVKMGVEAREQIVGPDGLQDKLLTRPDHPLVRYAQTFTHNFELIAERLSVVHHLREVAKATVLAKFLIDSQVPLGAEWFARPVSASGAPEGQAAAPGMVPQLWRERWRTEIRVEDGALLGAWEGPKACRSSVCGGVNLGLQRFPFAAGRRMPAGVSGVSLAGASAFQFGQGRASIMAFQGVGDPKGVDLCLERFDVSAPQPIELPGHIRAAAGGELVAALRGESAPTLCGKEAEELAMLKAVFSPSLSDRLEEGESFVGPDPSSAHMEKLQSLLQEEGEVRQERERRFLSAEFDAFAPGSSFPECWTSPIQIVRPRLPRRLRPLPSASADLELFKSLEPAFDRSTEDGQRFRIYRQGGLEVRSIQRPGSHEVLGAAFSTEAPQDELPGSDRVLKVTKYVAPSMVGDDGHPATGRPHHRYCLMLETQPGDVILTERLQAGGVTWEENPEALELLALCAKVVGSVDCRRAKITVEDTRKVVASLGGGGAPASSSECKRYAQGAYNWARSQARCVPSVVQKALDGLSTVQWGPAATVLPPRQTDEATDAAAAPGAAAPAS